MCGIKISIFICTITVSECTYAYPTQDRLNEHWTNKHALQDDPLKTKHKRICGEGFATTGERRTHFIIHHTEADDPIRLAFYERVNANIRWRYANDETFRIICLARAAIRRVLDKMGLGKVEVSEELLGCTYDELVVHLNTNNRGFVYGDDITFGKLHIDHIRPIANFNVLCYIELKKACNFNNLQLLPWKENNKKRDEFPPAAAAVYAISVGGMAIAELAVGWRASGICKCALCVRCV